MSTFDNLPRTPDILEAESTLPTFQGFACLPPPSKKRKRSQSPELTGPIKCTKRRCRFEAPDLETLHRHIETKHNKGAHKCVFCNYSTNSLHDLKKHIRKHTGEKPYKCHHCRYSSAQSSALHKHMKTKHPNIKRTREKMRPSKSPHSAADQVTEALSRSSNNYVLALAALGLYNPQVQTLLTQALLSANLNSLFAQANPAMSAMGLAYQQMQAVQLNEQLQAMANQTKQSLDDFSVFPSHPAPSYTMDFPAIPEVHDPSTGLNFGELLAPTLGSV